VQQKINGQRTTDHGLPLNLALLGYGKLGRAIAQLAPQRGLQVRLILTSQSNQDGAGITRDNFHGIDVCLDFTAPGAVVGNLRRVAALGCNLVVGTTGWQDKLDEVRQVVESSGVGLVYGANFCIGVQLFYQTARAAADVFSRFPSYEPYITETHHRFKRDAPSGTALELKKRVQPAFPEREIGISSTRAGYVPGTHELGFDSEADTVILRHTARSRQGFAEGALHAARWVVGKKGLFTFGETLATERTGDTEV
jgi:4-hydroxy-tetrahydrodipicolinate reductase